MISLKPRLQVIIIFFKDFVAPVAFIHSRSETQDRVNGEDMQQSITGWELNLQLLQEDCNLYTWAASLNQQSDSRLY